MTTIHNLRSDRNQPTFVAQVPSNIAFLKYWGKSDETLQWPANDSLSMTLSKARTITKALNSARDKDRVFVHGNYQDPHGGPFAKSYRHLEQLRKLTGYKSFLDLFTENTFPSACGIASSASGMGALTLAALAAWTGASSLEELAQAGFDRSRLAHLSRLGSGSAGRSFWGGFVVWEKGLTPDRQHLYPLTTTKPLVLADLIAIVSREPKGVSSSEGHRRAWSSPLFAPRLAIHPQRMKEMRQALQTGDLEKAGELMETEALEMHAVMMTAQNPANYLTTASTQLITWIRQERVRGNLPAWFTIDAGPNIHILCAAQDRDSVHHALLTRYESPSPVDFLVDETGQGPYITVE